MSIVYVPPPPAPFNIAYILSLAHFHTISLILHVFILIQKYILPALACNATRRGLSFVVVLVLASILQGL
jgi:hypothetical protein